MSEVQDDDCLVSCAPAQAVRCKHSAHVLLLAWVAASWQRRKHGCGGSCVIVMHDIAAGEHAQASRGTSRFKASKYYIAFCVHGSWSQCPCLLQAPTLMNCMWPPIH